MTAKKKGKYSNRVKDWAPIENEWAAGQLSRADIARKFNCSTAACRKHMRKQGIEYGSLAESIRLKVQSKLVENPEVVPGKVLCPEPLQAADRAAERGADIIRFHRQDIAEQFEVKKRSERFLAKVADGFGDDKEIGLEQMPLVKMFVDAHDRVVQTTERLIRLQRQAYSLDDKGADKNGDAPEVVIHDPTSM
jgi:hypothetical protein